jgi:hypothetical protein
MPSDKDIFLVNIQLCQFFKGRNKKNFRRLMLILLLNLDTL